MPPVASPPAPAAPQRQYFLPPGYAAQAVNRTLDRPDADANYWTDERIALSARYQAHVYRLAAALITRHRLRSVLDVGCGPCAKLRTIIEPLCTDITGLDQPTAIATARRLGVLWPLVPVDLERPQTNPTRSFDLILCADVLEHLSDPDPTLDLIRAAARPRSLIVLSTPERRRLRGRACLESRKPEHVREWSRTEFIQFVRSRGFRVLASRLMPQDESSVRGHRHAELRFRLRLADRSPLCCHALVCRVR
jgi:SAM-dependent methyltransferase